MKKPLGLLISLLLLFCIMTGCSEKDIDTKQTNSEPKEETKPAAEEETFEVEESVEIDKITTTPPANSIFIEDWESFKEIWAQSIKEIEPGMAVLDNAKTEKGFKNTRYTINIDKGLFLAIEVDEENGNVVYGVVIGAAHQDDYDTKGKILLAATNLVKIADGSLPLDDRKSIVIDRLGLNYDDGIFQEDEPLEYSINGVTYLAELEIPAEKPSYNTITVSVEWDNRYK